MILTTERDLLLAMLSFLVPDSNFLTNSAADTYGVTSCETPKDSSIRFTKKRTCHTLTLQCYLYPIPHKTIKQGEVSLNGSVSDIVNKTINYVIEPEESS